MEVDCSYSNFDPLDLSRCHSNGVVGQVTDWTHQVKVGAGLLLEGPVMLHLQTSRNKPQSTPAVNSWEHLYCVTCLSASCSPDGSWWFCRISSSTAVSHDWHCWSVSWWLTCFWSSLSRLCWTCEQNYQKWKTFFPTKCWGLPKIYWEEDGITHPLSCAAYGGVTIPGTLLVSPDLLADLGLDLVGAAWDQFFSFLLQDGETFLETGNVLHNGLEKFTTLKVAIILTPSHMTHLQLDQALKGTRNWRSQGGLIIFFLFIPPSLRHFPLLALS